jgi:hypothetical protein
MILGCGEKQWEEVAKEFNLEFQIGGLSYNLTFTSHLTRRL